MDDFQKALREEFLRVLDLARVLEKETGLSLNLLLEVLSTIHLSMEIDVLVEHIANLIQGYTAPTEDEDLIDYV
ncbi:MAG: hypothetical protein QXJ68_07935 [Methanocellales archaeon]